MSTFTFATAIGAALAATAFALAGPAALASADATDNTPSRATQASDVGNPDDQTTSDSTARDIANYRALKDALRNGMAYTGAPIAGLDAPVNSLPDGFPGDLADVTLPPDLP